MKKSFLLIFFIFLFTSGCTNAQDKQRLPYGDWGIAVFYPEFMNIWIESVDVIDQRGRLSERVYAGIGSTEAPPFKDGRPTGWPTNPGGSSKTVTGVDLPEFIFVRWQSLVEPQTYNVRINIPQWVRDRMVTKEQPVCPWSSDWGKDLPSFGYRDVITIGLAPGGIAKAWLQGPCLKPVEIARVVGAISKDGPDLGRNNGEYAYPITPESKAYIEKFGIPYGSW